MNEQDLLSLRPTLPLKLFWRWQTLDLTFSQKCLFPQDLSSRWVREPGVKTRSVTVDQLHIIDKNGAVSDLRYLCQSWSQIYCWSRYQQIQLFSVIECRKDKPLLVYEKSVRAEGIEEEGCLELDLVHLYPSTLLKLSHFFWEATRTCKNTQDFSNYEHNVRLR